VKKNIPIIVIVLLLGIVQTCQKRELDNISKANIDADIAAIKATNDEWIKLYNTGDFEKMVSLLYTENSIIMSPDKPAWKGKEAILLGNRKEGDLYDDQVDSSIIDDIKVSGNLATMTGRDMGTMTPRSGGEPVRYGTKWLIVLERQTDGTWKYLYEIWNDSPVI